MTIPVPTLSTDGWVTSTSARCDALFADFVAAAKSQYPQGEVESSLPWLLVRYQGDKNGLVDGMQRVLTSYFERYFTKVTTVIRAAENPQDVTRIDLYINLTVIDEQGNSFTLGRIATVGEQRVLALAKENNGTLPTMA